MGKKGQKCPRVSYSRDTLKQALAAIKMGVPINTAANKFNIPRSTLHNKIHSKYADKRPGPDTILTTAEENSLIQWIENCSKIGMPVSKQQLLNSVALLVKILARENPFSNGRPGRHWFQSFLKRHENNGSDKLNENFTLARMPATEPDIRTWFTNVNKLLEAKNLLNIDPTRIFCTETLLLETPFANEDEESLSIQVAGNAAGQLITKMVLFSFRKLSVKFCEKLPKDWICSTSDTGTMTAENLYEYITKGFHPCLVENEIEFPIVLFIEGRVTLLTLPLTDFCLRNKIELIAMHPNASNVIHPLELTMFPVFKTAWQDTFRKYQLETKTNSLLKEEIITLLKTLFDSISTSELLINGFQQSGLYPWSEDAVDFKKIIIKKTTAERPRIERLEFQPFVPEAIAVAPIINESTEMAEHILHYIEQRLSTDILLSFKNVDSTKEWTGRIEDTSLYYFWRSILDSCQRKHSDTVDSFNIKQENNDSENLNQMPIEILKQTDINSASINDTKVEDVEMVENPMAICVAETM